MVGLTGNLGAARIERGDIAQLGERCVRIAEVGGSSPPISTTSILAPVTFLTSLVIIASISFPLIFSFIPGRRRWFPTAGAFSTFPAATTTGHRQFESHVPNLPPDTSKSHDN